MFQNEKSNELLWKKKVILQNYFKIELIYVCVSKLEGMSKVETFL